MRRLSGLLECAKPRPRQYLRGAQGLTAADAVLSAGAHNGQGFEGQGDEHDGSSVRRDGIIVSSLSFTGVPRAHGPIWGAALGEDGCPVAVPLGPVGSGHLRRKPLCLRRPCESQKDSGIQW